MKFFKVWRYVWQYMNFDRGWLGYPPMWEIVSLIVTIKNYKIAKKYALSNEQE